LLDIETGDITIARNVEFNENWKNRKNQPEEVASEGGSSDEDEEIQEEKVKLESEDDIDVEEEFKNANAREDS
jgi:hypothetical protein